MIINKKNILFRDNTNSSEIKDDEPYKILVVDDEESMHAVTSIVLKNFTFENKKIKLLDAYSAIQAKDILKNHLDVALILLDVVMETDDAGLRLVEYIREDLKNSDVRIVLRTGQAGFAPEKEVIVKYDINDYKEKTDLTNIKLYTTVYTALRSYRDIKNIRKLQFSLQKSETSLIRAQKNVHIGNWEWNLVTNKIFYSNEMYNIFGLNTKETKSDINLFYSLIHPDDVEYVYNKINSAIESKKSYSLEYRIVLSNNNIRFISEQVEVTLDEKENLVKLFGVSQDITKQKEAERILRENEEMQNEIFRQKIKEQKIKEISDAKDSFLLLFTHELKTPLNAIINFTKYLLKNARANTLIDVPYEKKIRLFEQIEISALRMLEDITNILDISRLKSNKITYKMSNFDPLESLKDVIQAHASLIKEYDTNISLVTNDTKKHIRSDEYRFKQILSNIISNAIKYSNKTVHISLSADAKKYIIIIEDNGNGIKDNKKAFALFEQIDDYVVSKSQIGTGIGLNFVKLLCSDLNIKYKLEDSEKLGGVKFTLMIEL